ncbi:MAG: polyprenyl synthetase family protein [Candidatus Marinimicrobia bacterium]|nr:polyprenyl synthetase family protein [Candidatus Neomarinimicrobiota bacterium]
MKLDKELKEIVVPILEDIKIFQQEFEEALRSEVRLINLISKYLIRHKGKGIRPILTILSARACGKPTLNSYKAAALVELIHIASLIHDDVVDDANKRRGFPSINRIWKNKASIVMGDFILSKVLTNLIQLRDFDVLDLISSTAVSLSSGEMLQIEKSYTKSISEDVYFTMIRNKTASLTATCCELGVITSSREDNHRHAMKSFGENFGMAFQIKDDLFDILGSEQTIGKNTNSDLSKNMITLPIIYTLSSDISRSEKKQIRKILKNGSSKKDMKILTNIIEEYDGFSYAELIMNDYSQKAIDSLSIFPDSPYKQSLIDLTLYNAQRTY